MPFRNAGWSSTNIIRMLPCFFNFFTEATQLATALSSTHFGSYAANRHWDVLRDYSPESGTVNVSRVSWPTTLRTSSSPLKCNARSRIPTRPKPALAGDRYGGVEALPVIADSQAELPLAEVQLVRLRHP